MTKANANAAANAQEQQAAQQQILRDLLALGKKNGRLTLKEISDALSPVSYTHLTLPTNS